MEIDTFPDWDPDSFASMGAWAKLTAKRAAKGLSLSSTASIIATAPGLSSDQEERGWGQVSQDFYGKFLKGMQAGLDQAPFPLAAQLWVAGYDWRNPNSVSAGDVLKRIKEVRQRVRADRVVVVTHSMGGLVLRHITSRTEGAALVEAVVHIGQPVAGATVAYRRLLHGVSRKVDGVGMQFLMGRRAETVAEVVSQLPSYFELLPTEDYRHSANPADYWIRERSGKTEFIVRPGPDQDVYNLYVRRRWPPSAVPTKLSEKLQKALRTRIISAKKLHQKLAGEPNTGTPPKCHHATWSLLSTKEMTDVTILAEHRGGGNRPRVHLKDGREAAGDGTVPAASAGALFPGEGGPLNHTPDPMLSRQFFVDGLVHDVMCEDADLQEGLLELVFAILSPRAIAAGGSGRITFDANLIWAKLFEATGGGSTAPDAAAEIRVAKYFAQRGHHVHLFKERPKGLTPDMHVSGIGNVEVKRLRNVANDDGEKSLRHAVDQVGFGRADTGQVVVVHSKDADEKDFKVYAAAAKTFVETNLGGLAKGVFAMVLSEDTDLPPLNRNP